MPGQRAPRSFAHDAFDPTDRAQWRVGARWAASALSGLGLLRRPRGAGRRAARATRSRGAPLAVPGRGPAIAVGACLQRSQTAGAGVGRGRHRAVAGRRRCRVAPGIAALGRRARRGRGGQPGAGQRGHHPIWPRQPSQRPPGDRLDDRGRLQPRQLHRRRRPGRRCAPRCPKPGPSPQSTRRLERCWRWPNGRRRAGANGSTSRLSTASAPARFTIRTALRSAPRRWVAPVAGTDSARSPTASTIPPATVRSRSCCSTAPASGRTPLDS